MINYNYADDLLDESKNRNLLMTDGTVTVSGTSYTVAGATITITNAELDAESFELGQSICSADQIRYGSCESGYIKFTMHENVAPIKGKTLKVYIMPGSDASKMLQLGVFKVDEDELASDRIKRTVTAYDAMYDILNADVASWYNTELPNSSTTKTLAQFRADFLTHFGITAESVTLANDSITIKRTIEPETLSGADVIKAICEINGCFGAITNEGKFRFVELSENLDSGLFPSETLYPSDTLYPQDVNQDVEVIQRSYYTGVEFEDYMSESITQLTIRTDADDVGATVGTSGNTYIITGNFLVYGYNATDLTAVATACLNKIKNRYYKPCSVNAVGNPLLEVGDGIRIRTTYRGIVTYILERRLTGIQALHDVYTAQGEQYFTEQLNSVTSQFKQLASKTAGLKVDVDGINTYVTEQLDDTIQGSYAYQTAQAIGSKVETSTFNSTVTQLNNSISAKVSSTGGDPFSFGWTLDANGFYLISNTTTVMECNQYGLDITGEIHNSGTSGEAFYGNGYMELSKTDGHDVVINALGVSATSPDKGDWGISKNGVTINYDLYKPTSITINGDTYLVLAYAI